MSDDSKPRRWPWLRIFRIVLIAPFVLIVFGWLVLYGDSVYQRRKAEKLLKDLKSFPFATANFEQVREFVLKHGGHPEQTELAFRGRKARWVPPIPLTTGIGHMEFDFDGEPPCTPQDCRFQLVIGNPISWFVLQHGWIRNLDVSLDGLGVRPWGSYLRFQIVDGKLQSAGVTAVSGVSASWRTWRDFFAFEYGVDIVTDRQLLGEGRIFDVGMRHVTGPPQALMETRVLASAQPQLSRALDINLSCTTRLSSGCTGFEELAPSAWEDFNFLHQSGYAPMWDDVEFGPEADLVWLFVGGTIFVASLAMLGAFLERLRPEKPANRRILQ